MPAEKYSRTYLKERFPAELREHLRQDDLPPTRLPSYDYLNAKGFPTRGLSKAIKRHFGDEATLNSFLRKHGFGAGDDGDWPTSDADMIRLLNGFRDSRRERNNDAATTISTMESAMRTGLRRAQDFHGIESLLVYARYTDETERQTRNEQMEEILDTLKKAKSDGRARNYIRYMESFYEYCKPRTRIDHNPVKEVKHQYRFGSPSSKDIPEITDEQVTAIWKTLEQLPDRQDLSDSVANLVERYGLIDWQIQAMGLIILGVASGPRSQEYVRMDCEAHWYLDTDDPFIEFPVRKNLPGEVPILVHPEFLEAYRDYMDHSRESWNGKPFPSSNAESGARTPSTLNNWLEAICEEAGVRLDDGTYPTLQNLRQRWMNKYLEVLRELDVHLELVADEAGTRNEEHVAISYRSSKQERKTIRSLAGDAFEAPLELDGLPEGMYDVIEKGEYVDTQLEFSDF